MVVVGTTGDGAPVPRRILIYGVTGSGKTTLGRTIGERLGLPWHSADDELGWLPGWTERPKDEQRAIAAGLVAADAWVLDTAYSAWRDLVLDRVELIVALDLPRWVSLRRLLRRTTRRVVTGELACNGNRETLRLVLSRDSIVAWHFRSFSRKRLQIDTWEAEGRPMVRLHSPAEVEGFVAGLGPPADGSSAG